MSKTLTPWYVSDSPKSQLVGGPIQENKEKVAQANPIIPIVINLCAQRTLHGRLT